MKGGVLDRPDSHLDAETDEDPEVLGNQGSLREAGDGTGDTSEPGETRANDESSGGEQAGVASRTTTYYPISLLLLGSLVIHYNTQ
jgi:hypothetical protein